MCVCVGSRRGYLEDLQELGVEGGLELVNLLRGHIHRAEIKHFLTTPPATGHPPLNHHTDNLFVSDPAVLVQAPRNQTPLLFASLASPSCQTTRATHLSKRRMFMLFSQTVSLLRLAPQISVTNDGQLCGHSCLIIYAAAEQRDEFAKTVAVAVPPKPLKGVRVMRVRHTCTSVELSLLINSFCARSV